MSKCEQGNSYVCGLATSIDLLPSVALLRDTHSPASLQAECLMHALTVFYRPTHTQRIRQK